MTVYVSGLDEGAPIFDEGFAPAKLLELLPGDDGTTDNPEFPGGDPVASPNKIQLHCQKIFLMVVLTWLYSSIR